MEQEGAASWWSFPPSFVVVPPSPTPPTYRCCPPRLTTNQPTNHAFVVRRSLIAGFALDRLCARVQVRCPRRKRALRARVHQRRGGDPRRGAQQDALGRWLALHLPHHGRRGAVQQRWFARVLPPRYVGSGVAITLARLCAC